MNPFFLLFLFLLLIALIALIVWLVFRRPVASSSPATPPTIALTPLGGELSVPVRVDYSVKSARSERLRIAPEYSTNSGRTYQVATERTGLPSSGLSNLSSSPGGTPHVFVWDAGLNLAPNLPQTDFFARGVLFRIQVFGVLPGNVADTGPFDVLSGVRMVTPAATTFSSQRSALWGSPVPVRYLLIDQASDLIDVSVALSLDGGLTFKPATEAAGAGSEGATGLASSPHKAGGVEHFYAWKADGDIPTSKAVGVLLRITTQKGGRGASVLDLAAHRS